MTGCSLPRPRRRSERWPRSRAENSRLKAAEPSFSIRCEDQSDTTVERYHASYRWYEPLTEAAVDGLMQRLKARFPLTTDFGSRKPAERPAPPTVANRLFSTRQVFTPRDRRGDREIPGRRLSPVAGALRRDAAGPSSDPASRNARARVRVSYREQRDAPGGRRPRHDRSTRRVRDKAATVQRYRRGPGRRRRSVGQPRIRRVAPTARCPSRPLDEHGRRPTWRHAAHPESDRALDAELFQYRKTPTRTF